MSNQSGPKITLFHSELVKRGPVVVAVESDVSPSRYPNKPFWVMLKLDGTSRRYDTENQFCAQALTGMRGTNIQIEATGTRDDARIIVHGPGQAPTGYPQQPPAQQPQQQSYRGGPPAQPQQQYPQQPPPQQYPQQHPQQQPPYQPPQQPQQPPQQPAARENPVAHCKRELNKIANGYLFCLAAGEYVRGEWDKGHPDRPMSDEQFQATVSTIFIAADRRMLFTDIPTGSIEKLG